MRKLAAYFALPRADRRLLIEAFATLVFVRVALQVWPIERLRQWSGRLGRGAKPVDRIAWAVRVASRRLPGTACLSSALALQRLLSAQGRVSELHIGVARQDKGIIAHAWIVCDEQVLIGDEERETFTRLTHWRAGEHGHCSRDPKLPSR